MDERIKFEVEESGFFENNFLAKEGFIKAVAPIHYGFMGGGGDQEAFTNSTGPEIARKLKEENVDAVILTAG